MVQYGDDRSRFDNGETALIGIALWEPVRRSWRRSS
jgi:hypothetical protein